jgi:NADPH:quinone reductase-like Zn-dependent oxidoreductase
MARAIVATAYGGPEVLALVDVPVRAPGPGEVTLEVRAAGINPIDYKIYSGQMGSDPSKLPMKLGYEVAGVVTAVGEGAVGPAGKLSVGDEVIGYQVIGGYTAELTTGADSVLPKPANLTWEQASGLLLTGTTAFHLLEATAVTARDTVLIHGASGGAGLAASQLALLRGARVIGTASGKNAEMLRRYGIEPILYGEGLAERVRAAAPGGVDVALDAVGTDEAVDTSLELVADRGRIATIAAFRRGPGAGIRVLGNGPGADPGTATRTRARRLLVDFAAQGKLDVVVARSFPLAEAAAAHQLVRGGHAGGKVVLIP